jgi:hypothetical protein
MTREELEKLDAQAEKVVKDTADRFIEALTLFVRLRVQKDMLFLETGDKTLVDKK